MLVTASSIGAVHRDREVSEGTFLEAVWKIPLAILNDRMFSDSKTTEPVNTPYVQGCP